MNTQFKIFNFWGLFSLPLFKKEVEVIKSFDINNYLTQEKSDPGAISSLWTYLTKFTNECWL